MCQICFHFVALGCSSPCLCTVRISFFCPSYELKHIDLGVQHGSVWNLVPSTLLLSLRETIDCWCWCVRSSLKSSVLPFNPTRSDSRTKALQKNTLKRNQNMYLYHFFDCHPAYIKRTKLISTIHVTHVRN